jgi:hypothetical protein
MVDLSDSGDRPTSWFAGKVTGAHWVILLALLLPFTGLAFVVTNSGVDPGLEHDERVIEATLGTITGPFVGAISRGALMSGRQHCCFQNSLYLAATCGPMLLAGIAVQFLPVARGWTLYCLRMALWALGWLVWFGGGLLSFGHALS